MSTPLADMVEHLLSTGIPPEAVVAAVRAAELHAQSLTAPDPVAERRRAYDRERKRNAVSRDSTGIPEEEVDQKERSPIPPKEKLHPQEPISENLVQGEEGLVVTRARKMRVACRLPDDWRPTPGDLEFASTVLREDRIGAEADKFRDYWHSSNGPPKRDWSAAWRNWCRKAVEFNGRNGNGRTQQGGGTGGGGGGGFSTLAIRKARTAGFNS